MAAWREREDFQHLELSYWWRHRVRMTNLGENFFRHLRTFLGRFPGFEDDAHVESGFAFYLLSQEKGGPGSGRILPTISFNGISTSLKACALSSHLIPFLYNPLFLLSRLGGYIFSPSLGHEAIRGTYPNHTDGMSWEGTRFHRIRGG